MGDSGITEARVRRPKKHDDFLAALHFKPEKNKTGIFNQYTDIMIFSAALGYRNNKKTPFTEPGEPIPYQYFKGNDKHIAFINTLAFLETRDLHILSNNMQPERVKIFEEYASCGLDILAEKLEGRWDYRQVILRMLLSTESQDLNDIL